MIEVNAIVNDFLAQIPFSSSCFASTPRPPNLAVFMHEVVKKATREAGGKGDGKDSSS